MDQSIIRITKELADLQRSSDLAIAVACRDVDVRNVKALIVGPHETPYEFGFYEPTPRPHQTCNASPPMEGAVGSTQTSMQMEKSAWYAATETASLMSANPFENEPGFENSNSPKDKEYQKAYVQKRYLGLQIDGTRIPPPKATDSNGTEADVDEATIPFEPFKDLCKRRFLWYFESYMAAIRLGQSETRDGAGFVQMPFEKPGSNSMEGKFCYRDLERRLLNIKKALKDELTTWAEDGLMAQRNDSTVAVNLRHQFEQMLAYFRGLDVPHSVSLENDNAFVWILTYFGRPMTNLDGGMLRIKLHFSPHFPNEQPRAIFQTKIFHHQIAPDGTYCYNPPATASGDVRSHIEAILELLEDDQPAYDPRKIVHPEATKLYWSHSPDEKKQYNRRLRRSVQDSME
ncbi:hypothetical protein ARSEF1564_008828 [Beauveria bassiana]